MDRERDRSVADDLIDDARKQIGGEKSKEQPDEGKDQPVEGFDKPKD